VSCDHLQTLLDPEFHEVLQLGHGGLTAASAVYTRAGVVYLAIRLAEGPDVLYAWCEPVLVSEDAARAAGRIRTDDWCSFGVSPASTVQPSTGIPRRGAASAATRRAWRSS
jgi:hypothetical protein